MNVHRSKLRIESRCYSINQSTVDIFWGFLSSRELKAYMSFSVHHGPSSVRLCLSLCLLTFHIFIFFSRTTRTISSKLGWMHPCIKAIQECPNEEPLPFPRGDDSEIAKKKFTILIHLLKNQWTNLTKPCSRHPWVKVKGIQVQMKDPVLFQW